MSAEVIVIDFKPKPRPASYVPAYYCLRCDGERFQLLSDGTVHCGACGSLMRNVQVVGRPESA